jgi:hypothetical protein
MAILPCLFLFSDSGKTKFDDAIINLLNIYEHFDKNETNKYFGNCFEDIALCVSKNSSYKFIGEQTILYNINDLTLYLSLCNAEVLHESSGFPIDAALYLSKDNSICNVYVVAPKDRWVYSNNSHFPIPDLLVIIFSETGSNKYAMYLQTKKIEFID